MKKKINLLKVFKAIGAALIVGGVVKAGIDIVSASSTKVDESASSAEMLSDASDAIESTMNEVVTDFAE